MRSRFRRLRALPFIVFGIRLYCGILFRAGHLKICAPKVRCNEKMRLAFAQDGVLSDASFHRDLIIPLQYAKK